MRFIHPLPAMMSFAIALALAGLAISPSLVFAEPENTVTVTIPVACKEQRCDYDAEGGTPINIDTFNGSEITAGYHSWERIDADYISIRRRYAYISFDLKDFASHTIVDARIELTPTSTGKRLYTTQMRVRSFVDNGGSRSVGLPERYAAYEKTGDLSSWLEGVPVSFPVTSLAQAAQAGLEGANPATSRIGFQFWLPEDRPFSLDQIPLTFLASESGVAVAPRLVVTFEKS